MALEASEWPPEPILLIWHSSPPEPQKAPRRPSGWYTGGTSFAAWSLACGDSQVSTKLSRQRVSLRPFCDTLCIMRHNVREDDPAHRRACELWARDEGSGQRERAAH